MAPATWAIRRFILSTSRDGCSAKREHPRSTHCIGGLHEAGAPTDQVTPNTQYATYQYADGTELHCDLRNWFSGPPEAQGIYIFGSKGWMKFGDESAQVFFGRKNEPGPTIVADEKRDSGQAHFENFIECVRSRKAENLRAPIEEGHFSTTLCHLGNISYRVGRSVRFDGAAERFVATTRPTSFSAARIGHRIYSRRRDGGVRH